MNSLSRMPPTLAQTAPRQKPAHLLRLYEFLLRAAIGIPTPGGMSIAMSAIDWKPCGWGFSPSTRTAACQVA